MIRILWDRYLQICIFTITIWQLYHSSNFHFWFIHWVTIFPSWRKLDFSFLDGYFKKWWFKLTSIFQTNSYVLEQYKKHEERIVVHWPNEGKTFQIKAIRLAWTAISKDDFSNGDSFLQDNQFSDSSFCNLIC